MFSSGQLYSGTVVQFTTIQFTAVKAGLDRTGRDDWDAAKCPPPYWPGRRGEMKMTGVSLPGAWGHPPLDTLDTVKTPLLVNHVSIFRLAGLALCNYKNKTYTDNSSPVNLGSFIMIGSSLTKIVRKSF